MSAHLLLGLLVLPGSLLEIERIAGIPDSDVRDAKLTEIALRLGQAGGVKDLELRAADEASGISQEQQSDQTAAPVAPLSDPEPSLPAPTDEVERLIDRIVEVAKSVDLGYRDLGQAWREFRDKGQWTNAHTERASVRKAEMERRLAVEVVEQHLHGAVA